MLTPDRRQMRGRVSWMTLYGEPLVILVAAMSVALILAVVLRPPTTNQRDFDTFWDAARWYREGVDPYLGHPLRMGAGYNLNAPAFIFLFLPFSYFPLLPASVAWTVAGLLAYGLSARWIACALAIPSAFLLLCGLLISQASFTAFQLGQVAPFLLPLFTCAWLADRSDRPWKAGLLLGVLIAAKPFFGMFGIYALLFRRSRPLVLGMVVGAAAFLALGLLAGGISIYRSWLVVLGSVTWPAHLANGSLLALVTREITPIPDVSLSSLVLRQPLVSLVWFPTLVLIAGVALWALHRITDRDQAWLLVGVCSFLLSPLGWVYYAPLLAGPVAARWQTAPKSVRVWLAAGYVCFCVPYSLLVNLRGTPAMHLIGSAYTWGFLAWFVAAISTARPHENEPSTRVT
jgi:Glycosyltransferase family 87